MLMTSFKWSLKIKSLKSKFQAYLLVKLAEFSRFLVSCKARVQDAEWQRPVIIVLPTYLDRTLCKFPNLSLFSNILQGTGVMTK